MLGGMVIAAVALVFLGGTVGYVAWLLYRRPGVSYFTWVLPWRARNYLVRPGVALWCVGTSLQAAGLIVLVINLLSRRG